MSKCSLVLQALALAAVATAADVKMEKPIVSVYYEALCDDSVNFITEQFTPVYNRWSNRFDIELVPFGNSNTTDGGKTWNCQHGPDECLGNKIQACAIKDLKEKNPTAYADAQVAFVKCMMLHAKDSPYPPKECLLTNNLIYETCAKSEEGNRLYSANMEKTRTLQDPLKTVPTVVFNNKYSEDDNMKARTNFQDVLCKYLNDPKPKECPTVSGVLSTTASGVTILATAVVFVLAQ